MRKTVGMAKDAGIAIGAHPGYPDLQGFGRRDMHLSPDEAYSYMLYQIGALQAFCSANIRAQQVDDESQVQKETAYAGLGTGVLLIVIYGALSYVGVVSGAIATIDPTKDTGATVLTNLTSSLFGTFGTAFLGIVFVIACLNVCTGLIGTCATYFHTRFRTVAGRTLSYRTWQVIFTVFSFIVSNAGLSAIIKVSVPVLSDRKSTRLNSSH